MLACSLEAYDRNENFCNVVDITSSTSTLEDWPCDLPFRQLTACHQHVLPLLSSEMIMQHFADVPTAAASITAVDKGRKLADSGRVAGCSFAAHNACIYFTGFVRAAMKKKVSRNPL